MRTSYIFNFHLSFVLPVAGRVLNFKMDEISICCSCVKIMLWDCSIVTRTLVKYKNVLLFNPKLLEVTRNSFKEHIQFPNVLQFFLRG